MYSTGFFKTDAIGKCDKCIHYKPLIKDLYGRKTMMCRGRCEFNNMYKQRTETCKKFKLK